MTRETKETELLVELDLDGPGPVEVETGVPFFDHMLNQLGKHGCLGLTVRAKGDTEIDAHHTVEDTSIALGQALKEALGDKSGIQRFGDALVPLDETLVRAAVDLSGRPYVVHEEPAGMSPMIGALRHHAHQAHLGVHSRSRPASACTCTCCTAATRTTSSRPSSRPSPAPCAPPPPSTRGPLASPPPRASSKASPTKRGMQNGCG